MLNKKKNKHFDVDAFDANIEASITLMSDTLKNCKKEIIRLAKERASGIGAKQYGSAIYTKPSSVVSRDLLEELADGAFYGSVLASRRN